MSSFSSWLSTTAVILGFVFFCLHTAAAVCKRVVFEPMGSPIESALGVEKNGLVLRDVPTTQATVWELIHASHDKKNLSFVIIDAKRKMALSTKGGRLLLEPYNEASKKDPHTTWLLRPATPNSFIISMTDSAHLSLAVRSRDVFLESYQLSQSKFFLMKMKDAKTGSLCRLTVFSPQGRQTEPEQVQFLFHSLIPSV